MKFSHEIFTIERQQFPHAITKGGSNDEVFELISFSNLKKGEKCFFSSFFLDDEIDFKGQRCVSPGGNERAFLVKI